MKPFFELSDLKVEADRLKARELYKEKGIWIDFSENTSQLKTPQGLFELFVTVFLDRGEKAEKIAIAAKEMKDSGLLTMSKIKDYESDIRSVLESHKIAWRFETVVEPKQICSLLIATSNEIGERYEWNFHALKNHVVTEVRKLQIPERFASFVSLRWLALEIGSLSRVGQKLSSFFLQSTLSYEAWPEFVLDDMVYLSIPFDRHIESYFTNLVSSRAGKWHPRQIEWYGTHLAGLMCLTSGICQDELDLRIWDSQRSLSTGSRFKGK